MCTHGWVTSLRSRTSHNVVKQLYPNNKINTYKKGYSVKHLKPLGRYLLSTY